MQAIEEKTAAGDTASVQQEVDGIVQQLRLHVCHLSLHHVLSLPFAFTWILDSAGMIHADRHYNRQLLVHTLSCSCCALIWHHLLT